MKRNTLGLLFVGFAGVLLFGAASPVSQVPRNSPEMIVYLSAT